MRTSHFANHRDVHLVHFESPGTCLVRSIEASRDRFLVTDHPRTLAWKSFIPIRRRDGGRALARRRTAAATGRMSVADIVLRAFRFMSGALVCLDRLSRDGIDIRQTGGRDNDALRYRATVGTGCRFIAFIHSADGVEFAARRAIIVISRHGFSPSCLQVR